MCANASPWKATAATEQVAVHVNRIEKECSLREGLEALVYFMVKTSVEVYAEWSKPSFDLLCNT